MPPRSRRTRHRATNTELSRRRAETLMMRLAGHTFAEIAEHTCVSAPQALRDYRHAVAEIEREWSIERHQYRALISDRLNTLFRQAWGPSLGCGCDPICDGLECPNPKPPDPDAFDRVMRVMEAQRRLYGLDVEDVQPDAAPDADHD